MICRKQVRVVVGEDSGINPSVNSINLWPRSDLYVNDIADPIATLPKDISCELSIPEEDYRQDFKKDDVVSNSLHADLRFPDVEDGEVRVLQAVLKRGEKIVGVEFYPVQPYEFGKGNGFNQWRLALSGRDFAEKAHQLRQRVYNPGARVQYLEDLGREKAEAREEAKRISAERAKQTQKMDGRGSGIPFIDGTVKQ
jgi:hypothetical protein